MPEVAESRSRRVVHEVVVERRSEVEGVDPLLLDQVERLAGAPRRLCDVAPTDQCSREQRVDAHRVVERHDTERPVGGAQPVLEHLRDPARPLGAMRSGHALRPAGCSGGVQLYGRLAVVEGERAGMLGIAHELSHFTGIAHDEGGTGVADAVVEVELGNPVRQRDDRRAEPLTSPVELDELGLVREDAGDAVAAPDATCFEARCDLRRPLTQIGVRQPLALPDERLRFRRSLGSVEEAEREIHAPATSAIASTIAV